LMRFSSSSRARAFRRSDINVVRPRMVDMFASLEKRPVPPPPPPMLLRIVDARFSLEYCKNRCGCCPCFLSLLGDDVQKGGVGNLEGPGSSGFSSQARKTHIPLLADAPHGAFTTETGENSK
jgi:hypothetical protein